MKRIVGAAMLGMIGGISLIIGLAFLTAAAWIALADRYDTLVAALVLGCVYVALSAVLLAILAMRGSRRPASRPPAPPPRPASDPLALVEAFFSGFEAARRKRGPRR
ncbi:phage holin family protein [Paracoccus onubensis]|uniref:phage holin family protein n=1 Tax=Paracoccus onubensis TaxID=1675788 RepID=UPI002731D807|nr:phage holin family protein [Paracoccus onubensis]MDP0927846.1 phage holin family protein [Paracoccus onubensis]